MKNGMCPKCNGTEVYRQDGSRLAHEHIALKEGRGRADILALGMKVAAPDKYVCAACGYLEYYLASEDDLEVVRENWERI